MPANNMLNLHSELFMGISIGKCIAFDDGSPPSPNSLHEETEYGSPSWLNSKY